MVRVPRACKACGTIFYATRRDTVYCSGKCRMRALRARDKAIRKPSYCAWCFKPFDAATGRALYCCKAHKQAAYRARQGIGKQMKF